MFDSTVAELDAEQCAAAVESNQRLLIEQSCRAVVLAAHWADLHPAEAIVPDGPPGGETPSRPGGDGTPAVAGFAAAELGCLLGTTAGAASRLLGDALDLRHRLPRTWRRVVRAEVPAHLARRVAQATRRLSREAAGLVDAEIAPVLTAVSFGRLVTLLEASVLRADPDAAEREAELAARERCVRLGRTSEHGLRWLMARLSAGDALFVDAMVARLAEILAARGDLEPVDVRRAKALGILAQPAEALRLLYEHAEPDEDGSDDGDGPADDHRSVTIVRPPVDPERARPRVRLNVHVSDRALLSGQGVGRVEEIGPVLVSRLRALVGDRVRITLRPVVDLNDEPAAVDCYEVPDRMREHLLLRDPADRFPYAGGMGRGRDVDHAVPFLAPERGGPSGQTRVGNLAPLSRLHHRLKTHGRWRLRQPEPGVTLWRSPLGRVYLVNASGTHPLGRGDVARAVWQIADPSASDEPHSRRRGGVVLAS